MMAHGKVASPYIYGPRTRGSAPAGKSQQVAGAGQRANSRTATLQRVQASREHIQRLGEQRAVMDGIAYMLSVAKQFESMADNKDNPNRLAARWIAQAIGADAARRFSED